MQVCFSEHSLPRQLGSLHCATGRDHGNAAHDGWTGIELRPPFRLAWAREFAGERLGTAMEPIVLEGRVFVATHGANLYALDGASGEPRWRFAANGPFLHWPAAAGSLVFVGSADDQVYALEAGTVRLRWSVAVETMTGMVRWRRMLPVPVRQTPWNTFWGTADESQSFTVAGSTVFIVHQGTLSGFRGVGLGVSASAGRVAGALAPAQGELR